MYNGTESIEELILRIQRLECKIDALTKSIQNKNQNNDGEWMTVEQLREYLPSHPSVSTIHRWTSTGEIPVHKSGKRLCFRKSEIDHWVDSHSNTTKSELAKDAAAFYNRSTMSRPAPWRS